MRPLAELRSTPSTTSSSSSCRSSSGSPPYTNGDGGGGGGGGAQGGNRRILTRSSALQSLKVLRSGRRTSSSLNSALSSSPLSKHSKVSSPVVVGGAYARHYHSYRTSSGSGRRVNTQSKTQPQLLQPPPLSRVKRRRSLRSTKGRRRSLNSPPHLVPQHDPPKLRSTTREKGDDDDEEEEEVNGNSGIGSSSSKRRSALWVLNCEAEEFLFGETAADKHELELPPPPPALELNQLNGNGREEDGLTIPLSSSSSPPPAKKQRRRWRETELSHLLETSPFLESKLRSSSSSTSSSSSDDPNSPTPPTPAVCHHPPSAKRRRVTAKKPKGGENQNGSSNSRPPHFFLPPPPLLQAPPLQPQQPPPELPASTTPPSLVASLPFTFSFEEPPSESLLWESHSPIMSFAPPISLGEPPPFRLPYESRRVLNRGGLFSRRLKVPRHARKSPRCHASTLAIVAATTEENPSPSPTPTVPPPAVPTSVVPAGPMSPLSRWVHETTAPPSAQPSPLRRSRRTATTTNTNGGQRSLGTGSSGSGGNSLSAQQFLWDSIQWLSDPYVVALLAGEEPPSAPIPLYSPAPPPPTQPTSQSSSSSAASVVTSSNERKASLRRPKNGVLSTSKTKPTTNGKVKGSNGIVNLHRVNGKVKNQPVVIMEDIMKSKEPPQVKESHQVPPLLFMSGDGLPPLIPWTA